MALISHISISGFRPEKGTGDQILNLKLAIEKKKESNNNIHLCFIDYNKTFDMISHEMIWNAMLEMGFSAHIVKLIKNLYSE